MDIKSAKSEYVEICDALRKAQVSIAALCLLFCAYLLSIGYIEYLSTFGFSSDSAGLFAALALVLLIWAQESEWDKLTEGMDIEDFDAFLLSRRRTYVLGWISNQFRK